ncbi:hypothetical protein D3C81_1833290 [compost metagenome]
MQLAAIGFQPAADFSNRFADVFLIGQIDLYVIFRTRWPRAVFGKILTRAGNDAPTRAREALDRGMANAATCPCQHQGLTFRICLGSIRPGRISVGNCRHENLTLNP